MAKPDAVVTESPRVNGAIFGPALGQAKLRPISKLVPYAKNARLHSDEQVAQIARSMLAFGWTVPVLVDPKGGIIAGHGRVLAAQTLGWTEVPCLVARGWSAEQKRLYVIADNQLTLSADWDLDLLASELAELKLAGVDLGLSGFDTKALKALLSRGQPGDPEAIPPVPAKPKSRTGDLYVLGDHRLLCGDSTEATDVARLLEAAVPHLMVTDPPYGVAYDPAWRARAGINKNRRKMGEVTNDDRSDWRAAWALFPGAVAYVWHAGTQAGPVAASLAACSFKIRAQIVWVKTRIVMGRGDYHHQHEPLYYAGKEGAPEHWHFVPEHEIAAYAVAEGEAGHWTGSRKQSTVWFIEPREDSGHGHGTQKPVECMRRPLENNSEAGDSVYEPFAGTGTTIVAAEMTGRRCFAMELEPGYVDVCVERWENFTGAKAKRIRPR